MKKILILCIAIILAITACSKEKKCFQCSIGYTYDPKSPNTSPSQSYTIDTTICNMTDSQIKDFEKRGTYVRPIQAGGTESSITNCN